MDIRLVTPGHLLAIAKRHAPNWPIWMRRPERGCSWLPCDSPKHSAPGLRCEGINLFLADGEAAFQEVFHTHLHVFPRFVGDTFRIDADWSFTPSRAELDEIAAQVHAVMSK